MKYYLWILGCAMNYSDAERIASVLNNAGYKKAENENDADIFIVVSCSVRQSAVNRIFGKVRDLKKMKAKRPFITILSGCVLKEDHKKLEKTFDIILKIEEIESLPTLLAQNNNINKAKSSDYLEIMPAYESGFRAFVPISTGCNNFCTYCAVPLTRGREKSRPMNDIINEVKNLIESGYKEITLLGQNVNSYGHDFEPKIKKNLFVELLKKIDEIEGEYRIYYYSNHPKDMSDELIGVLPDLKHFPHYIHLPLQSGNDEIIRKMNRHYTKKQYLSLIGKIRKALPDVAITTDIIVGFPGEINEQFEDTIEVMKKVNYDMAFIAQYSPRPGTESAKLNDDVTNEEKRKREDILQKVLSHSALDNNRKFIGKKIKVLIDGTKRDKIYGRTDNYKVVEIKSDNKDLVGSFVDVEITSATPWVLIGKLT